MSDRRSQSYKIELEDDEDPGTSSREAPSWLFWLMVISVGLVIICFLATPFIAPKYVQVQDVPERRRLVSGAHTRSSIRCPARPLDHPRREEVMPTPMRKSQPQPHQQQHQPPPPQNQSPKASRIQTKNKEEEADGPPSRDIAEDTSPEFYSNLIRSALRNPQQLDKHHLEEVIGQCVRGYRQKHFPKEAIHGWVKEGVASWGMFQKLKGYRDVQQIAARNGWKDLLG